MNVERFKPFLLGIGILAGTAIIVLGLGAAKPETEKQESEKPPLVVRTAEATFKEQTVFGTFQGEVRAKTNIELVTQVAGKVVTVSDAFIEGGEFKAGDILLQIDDADYLVALKAAEASVASAQVDVEVERATAENRAKEWQDLQGKPIDQANPLLLNKPQIDRAKARLAAARAELAAANLNYQRTKISAPFDGRIMTKSAELGQFMSRGSSIGRVFATQSMEVRIPMTDVQIRELGLQLGYSARTSGVAGVPATVSTLFGDVKRSWPGFVKNVDASIDAQTRLVFATVVVDQPFGGSRQGSQQASEQSVMPLVPGLFVDVALASPQKLSGIELPRTALRNGNQVYIYQDDQLRIKDVSVVFTSEEKVIVKQDPLGVQIGEEVITSSIPGAHESMAIKQHGQDFSNIADAGDLEGSVAASVGDDTAQISSSSAESEEKVKAKVDLDSEAPQQVETDAPVEKTVEHAVDDTDTGAAEREPLVEVTALNG